MRILILLLFITQAATAQIIEDPAQKPYPPDQMIDSLVQTQQVQTQKIDSLVQSQQVQSQKNQSQKIDSPVQSQTIQTQKIQSQKIEVIPPKKESPGYKSWTKITRNDVLVASFMLLAGSADAVNQALIHHQLGLGNQFWDTKLSWKNKYKDYDNGDYGPKFFGSKDILVGLTDGFHLTRTIDRSFTVASIAVSAVDLKQYRKQDRWKVIARKLILSTLFNRGAFIIIFNNLYGPN